MGVKNSKATDGERVRRSVWRFGTGNEELRSTSHQSEEWPEWSGWGVDGKTVRPRGVLTANFHRHG